MKIAPKLVELAAAEVGTEEVDARHLYCIYAHKMTDSGEIFYVGRAKKDRRGGFGRAKSTSNRSCFWRSVVAKHGFFHEILSYHDTMDSANREETRLIALFGKRICGGILCNLADGGEGNSGAPRTETWRQKMRDKALGRKLSEAHKEKLRIARRGSTLSMSHRKAISEASKRLKNFRLCDPDVRSKAQANRKMVKTRPRSREHQDKINASLRGQTRSAQSRMKMSLAAKNRCQNYQKL